MSQTSIASMLLNLPAPQIAAEIVVRAPAAVAQVVEEAADVVVVAATVVAEAVVADTGDTAVAEVATNSVRVRFKAATRVAAFSFFRLFSADSA